MLRWLCIPAFYDTTSEPQVGNSLPGMPVIASMSGSASRATRVEPWNTYIICIPPLIMSGAGCIFLLPKCPLTKRRKYYV